MHHESEDLVDDIGQRRVIVQLSDIPVKDAEMSRDIVIVEDF